MTTHEDDNRDNSLSPRPSNSSHGHTYTHTHTHTHTHTYTRTHTPSPNELPSTSNIRQYTRLPTRLDATAKSHSSHKNRKNMDFANRNGRQERPLREQATTNEHKTTARRGGAYRGRTAYLPRNQRRSGEQRFEQASFERVDRGADTDERSSQARQPTAPTKRPMRAPIVSGASTQTKAQTPSMGGAHQGSSPRTSTQAKAQTPAESGARQGSSPRTSTQAKAQTPAGGGAHQKSSPNRQAQQRGEPNADAPRSQFKRRKFEAAALQDVDEPMGARIAEGEEGEAGGGSAERAGKLETQRACPEEEVCPRPSNRKRRTPRAAHHWMPAPSHIHTHTHLDDDA
jgi:hypothetical protein